jgi:hypothetical protein
MYTALSPTCEISAKSHQNYVNQEDLQRHTCLMNMYNNSAVVNRLICTEVGEGVPSRLVLHQLRTKNRPREVPKPKNIDRGMNM